MSSRWPSSYGGLHEVVGFNPTGTNGINVTTHATLADTKGSWVTNAAYVPAFDWEQMVVYLNRGGTADFVFDIAVYDGSANYTIICPDLRLNGIRAGGLLGVAHLLPLRVPAGRQLAFRAASSVANLNPRVWICGSSVAVGGGRGFSRMVALYTPQTSRGIDVDAGGTVDTLGAWTQLTASVPERIGAISVALGAAGDNARAAVTAVAVDIGIGSSGNERILVPKLGACAEAVGDVFTPNTFGPWGVDVPAGARISARAQCSVNTAGDRVVDVAAWGFVP